MANNYKTDQVTLNAANTDFTILTASASTTLVKNITWIHEGHNTVVKLSLTKSGGTKTVIGVFSAVSNTSTKIWTDILPLEAGDVLFLQSDHISGSDVGHCVVSYVTTTSSVSGQSIGVLTDVDLTGNATGKILSYNGNQFAPIANATYPSADATKLSGIETGADVTDSTNVTAAGALMAATAQLAGDLDTATHEIKTTTTNGNVIVAPNGTGFVEIKGNEASSADNPGAIRLNCAANTHGVTIQSPPHSSGATYTLTLPPGLEAGDANKVLKTDANGALDWVSQTVNTDTNTQNTTTLSFQDSSNDVILRNTTGGAGSGTQDVKFVAGSNITLTHTDANNITIASSGGGGGGGGSVTGVTGTAPIVSSGGTAPVISITAASASAAGSMSAADKVSLSGLTEKYLNNELITGPNTLFEGSSTTNNKIADVLGAAVASRDNANAKKMLGFHTGSGVYVLRGMVDAVDPINGSSAGSPLWLGASGVFDSEPPDTTNHYSRIVGYFLGTGAGSEVLCYFDPSRDWVQIDQ